MVKKLIECLKKVEENDEIEAKTYLTNGTRSELHKDIQDAVDAADGALITNTGKVNWDNKAEVTKAGYNVFPGEKDSFGWLTGCIRTNKGIIVFG